MESSEDHPMRDNPTASKVQASVDQLSETLNVLNHRPIRLMDNKGMGVLILPHGGRVLGLHSQCSDDNFLWTNPALMDVVAARELFESDGWRNTGGDRTWLSPELNFFFPKYPDTSSYLPPPQLDAAVYETAVTDTEAILRAELSMRFYRGGDDLRLRIVKLVQLTADPLRTYPDWQSADLEFAGYRLHTFIQPLDQLPRESYLAIWNLLQLQGGGELLAATYSKTTPTVFFGTLAPTELQVDDRVIRYQMRAPGEQKLCIPAIATTGRIGYCFPEEDRHVLVVRSFTVNPSGEYKDVWFTNPENDGYAVQACNINNKNLGRFAELEYHAPAIRWNDDIQTSHDDSCVWVYRGQMPVIAVAAKLLLGVDRLA